MSKKIFLIFCYRYNFLCSTKTSSAQKFCKKLVLDCHGYIFLVSYFDEPMKQVFQNLNFLAPSYSHLQFVRGAITKKNRKIWGKFPKGGGVKKQTKIPNFILGI